MSKKKPKKKPKEKPKPVPKTKKKKKKRVRSKKRGILSTRQLNQEFSGQFSQFAKSLQSSTKIEKVRTFFESMVAFVVDRTHGMKNSTPVAISAWTDITDSFRKVLPELIALNEWKDDFKGMGHSIVPDLEETVEELDDAVHTLYISDIMTLAQYFFANALDDKSEKNFELEMEKAKSAGSELIDTLKEVIGRKKNGYEPPATRPGTY